MASQIVDFSSSSSFKFNWRIENFSKLNSHEGHYSDVFSVGSFKWKALIYPKGRVGVYDHISLFLGPVDLTKSVNMEFSFKITSQTDPNIRWIAGRRKIFPDINNSSWGWEKFMPVSELHNPHKRYVMNDTCIIKVEVTCRRDEKSKDDDDDVKESDPNKVANAENENQTKQKDDKSSSESGEYPWAGKPFGEGKQSTKVSFGKEEEFEDVGGFCILKTQAPVYKLIWLRYGHIPSTKVLPISAYRVLVLAVRDLMSCVMDMHNYRFVDLTSEMIQGWEDKINMADKLEFNIGWLRQRFETVKEGMGGMQRVKTELLEHGQPLRVAKEKMKILRDAMKKVEVQLIEAKGHVRDNICGLLSESDMEIYLEIG